MKRIPVLSALITLGIAALLFSSHPAERAAQAAMTPVTQETGLVWQIYSASFTSVTTYTFDPAGLNGAGISTSPTGNVYGFAYSIYTTSATATYTISQTTKTYSSLAVAPAGFNNTFPNRLAGGPPAISTSAPSNIPSGVIYNGIFQARTLNPVFTFSGLNQGATTWIWLEGASPATP